MSRNASHTKTFRVETLGCKANQYDSQRISEALRDLGLRAADDGDEPDVVVVNTCTITHRSDSKARKIARRAARSHPDAEIIVTGCYASASADELENIEEIDGVYPRDRWDEMMGHIAGAPLPAETASWAGDYGISEYEDRTRAVLKIQEGCDHYCSYCIVPHVRGRSRSRPLPDVVREARRLVETGFREIVLTGIHLGKYGEDLANGLTLADAVRSAAEVSGLERLRLSSIKADEVGEELLEAMQAPTVCPHLHLPLQSGDDTVLCRMERGYTAERFMYTVRLARSMLNRPAITTDVMAGFPGETEEMFENTVEVCEQARFSRMHVFPFSARAGTKAAEMDGQLHSKTKKKRCRRLRSRRKTGDQNSAVVMAGTPAHRLAAKSGAGPSTHSCSRALPAASIRITRVWAHRCSRRMRRWFSISTYMART